MGYKVTDQYGTDTFPLPDKCETCGGDYAAATGGKRMFCEDLELNKKYRHCLIICSHCYWFYQHRAGVRVPKTIRKILEQGFRPRI